MIVAGFGCRKAATLDSLLDAYDRARGRRQADSLAATEEKAASVKPLADRLGLPLLVVTKSDAQAQATQTQSKASLATHGTGSLSEAAALAAAGPKARLLAPRSISNDRLASCALATGEMP